MRLEEVEKEIEMLCRIIFHDYKTYDCETMEKAKRELAGLEKTLRTRIEKMSIVVRTVRDLLDTLESAPKLVRIGLREE